MIYRDRDVSLFRAIILVISLATVLLAGAAYATKNASTPEVLVGLASGCLLFVVGEWLVPAPIAETKPVPLAPGEKPPPLKPWDPGKD